MSSEDPQDEMNYDDNTEQDEASGQGSTPVAKMYPCKHCDFKAKKPLLLGTHMNTEHKDIVSAKRAAKKDEREKLEELERIANAPPPPPPTEEEIRSDIALKGRPYLNELKRERLAQVLGKVPKVPAKAAEYVMWKWDTDESIRDDPYRLQWTMKGAAVDDQAISEIMQAVWSLEDKYAPFLFQGNHMYVPFNRPGQPNTTQFNQYGQPFGQQGGPPYTQQYGPQYQNMFSQPPQYAPYGQSPQWGNQVGIGQPAISRRDIDDAVARAVAGVEATHSKKPEQDMVEMPIPILDGEGNVVLNDDGQPWFKTSKVPANLVPMFMNMQRQGGNSRSGEMSEAVKEAMAENKAQLNKATEMIDSLKKDLQQKEKENLLQMVNDAKEAAKSASLEAKNAISEARNIASNKVVDGYNNDSYRFMGQGMNKGAEVFEKLFDKEPAQNIAKMIFAGQQNNPVQEKAEEFVGSAMEIELKKRDMLK